MIRTDAEFDELDRGGSIDPADTRDCDGYPGLAGDIEAAETDLAEGRTEPLCPCGDTGDCPGCGS